jgi:hypothetical protein
MPHALRTFIEMYFIVNEQSFEKNHQRHGKIWSLEACILHAQRRDSDLKCSHECLRESGRHS